MTTVTPDLTLEQVSNIIQMHREHLRRLAVAGRLPGAYRVGCSWRVRADAVEALRRGESQKPAGGAE